MSAFMVEDSNINCIVTYLLECESSGYYCSKLANAGFKGPLVGENLGKEMFNLNCASVEAQYGEGQAKEFRPLNYKYKRVVEKEMQVYASFLCFLYQSCEGGCDEHPFYLLLEGIAAHIAHGIIRKLPAYQATKWR